MIKSQSTTLYNTLLKPETRKIVLKRRSENTRNKRRIQRNAPQFKLQTTDYSSADLSNVLRANLIQSMSRYNRVGDKSRLIKAQKNTTSSNLAHKAIRFEQASLLNRKLSRRPHYRKIVKKFKAYYFWHKRQTRKRRWKGTGLVAKILWKHLLAGAEYYKPGRDRFLPNTSAKLFNLIKHNGSDREQYTFFKANKINLRTSNTIKLVIREGKDLAHSEAGYDLRLNKIALATEFENRQVALKNYVSHAASLIAQLKNSGSKLNQANYLLLRKCKVNLQNYAMAVKMTRFKLAGATNEHPVSRDMTINLRFNPAVVSRSNQPWFKITKDATGRAVIKITNPHDGNVHLIDPKSVDCIYIRLVSPSGLLTKGAESPAITTNTRRTEYNDWKHEYNELVSKYSLRSNSSLKGMSNRDLFKKALDFRRLYKALYKKITTRLWWDQMERFSAVAQIDPRELVADWRNMKPIKKSMLINPVINDALFPEEERTSMWRKYLRPLNARQYKTKLLRHRLENFRIISWVLLDKLPSFTTIYNETANMAIKMVVTPRRRRFTRVNPFKPVIDKRFVFGQRRDSLHKVLRLTHPSSRLKKFNFDLTGVEFQNIKNDRAQVILANKLSVVEGMLAKLRSTYPQLDLSRPKLSARAQLTGGMSVVDAIDRINNLVSAPKSKLRSSTQLKRPVDPRRHEADPNKRVSDYFDGGKDTLKRFSRAVPSAQTKYVNRGVVSRSSPHLPTGSTKPINRNFSTKVGLTDESKPAKKAARKTNSDKAQPTRPSAMPIGKFKSNLTQWLAPVPTDASFNKTVAFKALRMRLLNIQKGPLVCKTNEAPIIKYTPRKKTTSNTTADDTKPTAGTPSLPADDLPPLGPHLKKFLKNQFNPFKGGGKRSFSTVTHNKSSRPIKVAAKHKTTSSLQMRSSVRTNKSASKQRQAAKRAQLSTVRYIVPKQTVVLRLQDLDTSKVHFLPINETETRRRDLHKLRLRNNSFRKRIFASDTERIFSDGRPVKSYPLVERDELKPSKTAERRLFNAYFRPKQRYFKGPSASRVYSQDLNRLQLKVAKFTDRSRVELIQRVLLSKADVDIKQSVASKLLHDLDSRAITGSRLLGRYRKVLVNDLRWWNYYDFKSFRWKFYIKRWYSRISRWKRLAALRRIMRFNHRNYRKLRRNFLFVKLLRANFTNFMGISESDLLRKWARVRRGNNDNSTSSTLTRFNQTLHLKMDSVALFLGMAPNRPLAQEFVRLGGMRLNGPAVTDINHSMANKDVLQLDLRINKYIKPLYRAAHWTAVRVRLKFMRFLHAKWSNLSFAMVRWPHEYELPQESLMNQRWTRFYIRYLPVRIAKYKSAKTVWKSY